VRVGPSANIRARNVDVENKDSNGHAGSWMDGFGARWRWAGGALASVAVLVMAGVYFSLMYPETPSRTDSDSPGSWEDRSGVSPAPTATA